MSAMAKILGAFAPGHSIDHGGKTFTFARCDHATIAALESAYFKRARQTVYDMRGELTEEEYERALDRETDKYNQGRFAFPIGESFGYFLSPGGLPRLVEALCGCTPADARGLAQDRTVEVMHVCLCVVAESFPDFKKKILKTAAAGGAQADALAALLSES